jgi:hypothetical protein
MHIEKWKKSGGGMMVEVNQTEALQIIRTLSAQILARSPNVSRTEFSSNLGYFSIAVFGDGEKLPSSYIKEEAGLR